ncbi:MAG: RloB domain-containing protein [Sphaerochaetaceae bacterium]|nr:RloB domain-containing protein [Sphaerochaetaceae bacterium]
MKTRKRKNQAPRKTMLIVGANEKEALFFSQVRKDARYSNLSVEWAGGESDLEKLISIASRKRSSGKFNEVWLVFSFVDLNVDVETVKSLIPIANKKKVNLCWSNPGINLWYLFHFRGANGLITDSNSIDNAIKKEIPDYKNTAKYLRTEGLDFYQRICVKDNDANRNARAYNEAVENVLGLPAINYIELHLAIIENCGAANFTQNQRTIGM